MENTAAHLRGTCLIAGCGYVGKRLAWRMLERGPVMGLVRSAASAEELTRHGLRAVSVDFDQEASAGLLNVPLDLSAVVYLAPPAGGGTEDLRFARFLAALGSACPAVLLYMSTAGVYGDSGGAAVDEASPVAPREDRSRQRLDAERRAAAWCEARGVRCVVFRVPAIYGPQRLPLDRLQRGEPVLCDEDSGPGNRIHVDDLVEACATALVRPVYGVFNLTDGDAESMAGFMVRLAALAGLPPPRRVFWAEAQSLMSPGILAFLRESRRVTSRRMQELGWAPRHANPDDGLRASLLEMGWAVAPEA
jgi:nucleoside-diphosphate-sugar epimerase